MPDIESLALPEHERVMRVHQRECNWLQALEGDIDTSHFSFLHLGTLQANDVPADSLHRFNLTDRAPRYHVKDTDWGTMYTAYRPAGDGQVYHRFSHFIFPFITLPPDGTFADHIQARHLGADGRHPHDGLHVLLDQAHRGAAPAQGRQPDPGLGVADGVSCPTAAAGTTAGGSRLTSTTTTRSTARSRRAAPTAASRGWWRRTRR